LVAFSLSYRAVSGSYQFLNSIHRELRSNNFCKSVYILSAKIVLVGVGELPENIKFQGSVKLVQDGEVEHIDAAAYFAFEGPFDFFVDGVEEGEERGDVISMDGRHGVVSLAEPEEDDANRGGPVGCKEGRG
jgi:hypothetical protein